MVNLVEEIGRLLRKHNLTLGSVESATGGLISHLVTNVSGSSDYYLGSIISYSNQIKMKLAKVQESTIALHGAVSAEVAEQMAAGGRNVLGVDICIADTGIAGPLGATPGKPVGLFYLGLSHRNGTFHRRHLLSGSREENKQLAAQAGLAWVKEYLLSLEY